MVVVVEVSFLIPMHIKGTYVPFITLNYVYIVLVPCSTNIRSVCYTLARRKLYFFQN